MDDLKIRLPHDRPLLADVLDQVRGLPSTQAANIVRLSDQFGVSPQQVAASYKQYENGHIDKVDWYAIERESPKTAKLLNDPYYMAIVRNNANQLAKLESTWSKISTTAANELKRQTQDVLSFAKGFVETYRNRHIESAEAEAEAEGVNLNDFNPDALKQLDSNFVTEGLNSAIYSDFLKRREVRAETKLGQVGLDVVSGLTQLATQALVGAVTGPLGAGAFMGAQIAGGDYKSLTEEGVDKERAFTAGVVDAVLQTPLEQISLNRLFKPIKAKAGAMGKFKEIAEVSMTEAVTEFLQKYPEAATELWAKTPGATKDERIQKFIDKLWDTTMEALYEGAIAGVTGGLAGGLKVALQSRRTQEYIEQREKVQDILSKSPLTGQSPEVTERALNDFSDNAKTYIDPQALVLFQKENPEVVEELGVTAEQVQDALAKGQMVEVDTSKYDLLCTQNTKLQEALKEDIAPDEEGITPRRIKERNIQKITQAVAEEKRQQDEVRRETDKILKQWLDSGAMTREQAKELLVALVSHGRKYSDNLVQYLREKAPLFRKGFSGRMAAGALHQYAGPGAKTADHLQLGRAREMEQAGADMEAIRKETGWFRGMDGNWRFEIDDSQARFIGPEQFKVMEGEIAALYKRANRTKDPAKKEELRAEAESRFQQFRQDAQPLLKNVLDHPVLYKAYPWIVDTKVVFSKLEDGHKGGYAPSINTIEINSALSAEEMKKTLIHEVQHIIQEQENFARGGSPESVRGVLSDKAKNLAKSLVSLEPDKQQLLEDWYKASKLSIAEDLAKLKATEQHIKEFDLDGKLRDARILLGKIDKSLDTLTSQQLYERLAAEIEARDTASRSDLTDEQRREKAPDLRSDAIVVYGGKEFAYSTTVNVDQNIKNGMSAMEKVISEHADVLNAMYRPEVGNISFYWGNPGKGAKLKQGSGISHIIARRNSEGQDGEAVAKKMVAVIAKGKVGEVYGPETGTRVNIVYDGHTAVLSLYKAGNIETWLLSGWKNNEEASGAIGEGYGSTDATLSGPMRTRPEEGADASFDIIIPKPGQLFQSEIKKGEITKGSIQWENGRAIITLFENADASTLIHEMIGHYFTQDLMDAGAREDAPDWMKKDRQTVLDYVGLTGERWMEASELSKQGTQEEWNMKAEALSADGPRADIRRAILDIRTAHEKMAKAAEVYIFEGKAPSLETRSMFQRFVEWLMDVYQTVKTLGVTLNPEIRQVFDHMLASEEEIEQMRLVNGYMERMPSAAYESLDNKHKAEVDSATDKMMERAKAQVRSYYMLFFTADNKLKIAEEEKAALERITEEVKKEPLYLAETAIEETFKRKAKTVARAYIGNTPFSPDGISSAMTPVEQLEAIRDSALQRGDEKVAEQMQRQIDKIGKKKVKELPVDQQMEFEVIAELHGFSSGAELAHHLLAYNTSEKAIQNRLEDHMTAFKESLTDKEALYKEAEEAMYSEEGASLIATELQAIMDLNAEKQRSREDLRKESYNMQVAARLSAQEDMAKLPVSKAMNTRTWIAGCVRAAESGQKALAKGDLKTAKEQKLAQLYNHAMVLESLRIRREFERIDKFLKKQRTSGRDTWMSDEISPDGLKSRTDRHYIQAADLLRRIGYARNDYDLSMRKETLAEYVAIMDQENPDMNNISDWLAYYPEEFINIRNQTIDQLKDIESTLRNIKRMARAGMNADGFAVYNGDGGVQATVDRMMDAAEKQPDALVDKIEKKAPGFIEKVRAGMISPWELFFKLDNYKEFGEWAKAMYYSVSDASSLKSRLQRMVYDAIDAAYESLGISKEQRLIDAHKKIYISEWKQSVTKNTLRAILLNMGSRSNKERLLGSYIEGISHEVEWSQEAVTAILTKYLSVQDFKLAQKIWDALNLLYEPYTQMVQKMTGSPLEKVEAEPISFTMPDGSVIHLRGGYYPLVQDPRASKQAELNAEKKLSDGFIGVMPYPNAGASKRRTRGAQYSVDLDITNIFSHVNDVTHDIAFRPVMHDINKLMRHSAVHKMLRRKLGEARYKAITEWQKSIARGKDPVVEGIFNDIATFIRSATVIKNLLFRPATLLQNMANPTLYGDSVKGFTDKDAADAYMKYGWQEYIPHALRRTKQAQEIREWVYSKSALMRDKMENPDYSIRELRESKYSNPLLWAQNQDEINSGIKNALLAPGIKIAITHEKLIDFGSELLAWTDQLTDIPMFRGAYFKAIAEGKTEQEAVHFAETVIKRSTGTGRKIDTSLMQRGSLTEKLLTMFMTFMNTQYNRWVMEAGIYQTEKDARRLIKFVAVRYLMFGALSAFLSFKWPDDDEENGWMKWFFKEVAAWPLGMIPIGGAMAKTILDTALGYKTFTFGLTPAERNLDEIVKLYGTFERYAEGRTKTSEILEKGSSVAAFLIRYPDQLNDWFWNAYDIISGEMDPRFTDLIRRRPKRER